jgi:hypothetical protein
MILSNYPPKRELEEQTLRVFFDYWLLKLNHFCVSVEANVLAEDHIFVEVTSIKEAGRKSNLLNIRINVIFSWSTCEHC